MEKIGRFWKKKQGVSLYFGANSYIIPYFIPAKLIKVTTKTTIETTEEEV